MSQKECDGRNIDTLVQQLHGEGMLEAVEGDMLVNAGCLYQKRDFVIEDIRGKGREYGTFFRIGLKMETASLESGMSTLFPVFLMAIFM